MNIEILIEKHCLEVIMKCIEVKIELASCEVYYALYLSALMRTEKIL